MSRMIDSAMKYLNAGKSVFPTGKDKKPLVNWKEYQDRLPTEEEIRKWWTEWPDANIAMVTGKLSGLVVVDCDSDASTRDFISRFPEAKETRQVKTGRGRHFYFLFEDGIRNDAGRRLGAGIDVRAAGGYVLVPPSVHANGTIYASLNDKRPISLASNLKDALLSRPSEGVKDDLNDTELPNETDRIKEGQRNVTLTQLGGLLRRLGQGQQQIENSLLFLNNQLCDPPLPSNEVAKIAESVTRYLPEEPAAKDTPWEKVKPAPNFLIEELSKAECLADDLLAPGSITMIVAPRGLGKTLVAHALAVALATGGTFRGERLKPTAVLLLDRDNGPSLLQQRLRSWGASEAENLHVLTRNEVPDLRDEAAWDSFPAAKYGLVIIDAVGSFTEGISEKEGKQTTEVLATVLNLARRGVAVLLLNNTTKDASNYRGRGEWADRVDIIYEVRDATGVSFSGQKPWCEELPEGKESDWKDRSARRKGRTDYRLAFIPSKFRIGPEPEPFCLEIHVPKDQPWSIRDVTRELSDAVKEAKARAKNEKEEQRENAAQQLLKEITERAERGEPISKSEAEEFLKRWGLPQHERRQLIRAKEGVLWRLEDGPGGRGKGKPIFLLPFSGSNTLSTTELPSNEVTTREPKPSGNKTSSVIFSPQSNDASISPNSEKKSSQEINSVTPPNNNRRPPSHRVNVNSTRPPSPRAVTPRSVRKKSTAWEDEI